MNQSISRNVAFLVSGTITSAFFTFVYWYVLATITSTEIVGVVSTVINFAFIIQIISTLQIPFGMKRFLGQAYSNQDNKTFSSYGMISLVLMIITVSFTILVLVVFSPILLNISGLDHVYLPFIAILIIVPSFQHLFQEILISTNKSKNVAIPIIIGTALRLPFLILLVLVFEFHEIGLLISFVIATIIASLLMVVYVTKTIFMPKNFIYEFKQKYKEIIQASIPKYIPEVLFRTSLHSGILVIFALHSASETGVYNILLITVSFFLSISLSVSSVLHPKISGASAEKQYQLASRSIFLTFMFLMPFVSVFYVFSEEMLGLVGNEYRKGGLALAILMISLPAHIFWSGVYHFSHAKGNYRQVYYMGTTQAVITITSYFILVPTYSLIGAATAFALGSVSTVIVSAIVAKQSKLKLEYKKYFIIIALPIMILSLLYLIKVNFIISFFITVLVSFVIYIKINYFTEKELNLVADAVSIKSTSKLYSTLVSIINRFKAK